MKIRINIAKGFERVPKGQFAKKGDWFWDGDSGTGIWTMHNGEEWKIEDTLVIRKIT